MSTDIYVVSTDFCVVCDKCKKRRHLGQSMGGTYSFGFGSKDAYSARDAAEWVSGHLNQGCELRIELSDVGVPRVSDHYSYVHDEKFLDDV